MGKAEQLSNNVPGLSPQTEASKLLEQALMQMDGIISGNTGSLTAHSPDYGFGSSPPGVREASNALATAIQNTPVPPPPDPAVVKVLLNWLQQTAHSAVTPASASAAPRRRFISVGAVHVCKHLLRTRSSFPHFWATCSISHRSVMEEDEVTFLLRLKPAPTPPLRRRRPSDDRPTVPKGWDVVIERREVEVGDDAPPLPPRLEPSAPPPEDNVYWYPKPFYPFPDYRNFEGFYHEARNRQSFVPAAGNSGCADLISNGNVSPGFHVNAAKPPKPQPRMSLIREDGCSGRVGILLFVEKALLHLLV